MQETAFHLGQLWRDEEGLVWRIVAAEGEYIYVKRHGHPHSRSVQTLAAWLHEWTPVD